MITKLDSLNDIANEFGVPLASAGNISYYYNNKNPDSPVQPVMAGGRITDWIGYDHHASSSIVLQVWYENPPTGRDFFRFFYTSSDYNETVSHLPTNFIFTIPHPIVHFLHHRNSNLLRFHLMQALPHYLRFLSEYRPH